MDLHESIANQTDASLILTTEVFSTEAKDSNSVLSPLSIQVILGLVASGAKDSTRDHLLSFLKSKSTNDLNSLYSRLVSLMFSDESGAGGPLLSFVNGLWVDQSMSLKPEFKELVDNVYKATTRQVDFRTKHAEVTDEVNQWAEKQTNGLIKDVIPADAADHTTRLILANALYFKGVWNYKFDASLTIVDEFHLLNGTSINVPYMTSNANQYVRAFDDFKVLGLPYTQGDDKSSYTMYFFLPEAEDGLPALLSRISSESRFIDRHLPNRKVEVEEIRIPKFKMSFGFKASTVLQKLGLSSLFCDDSLTEMVDSPLEISGVYHKSFVEVNEEGTEAAAVTVALARIVSVRSYRKLKFDANRPFFFVIRENTTGVLLFTGQVHNPSLN